MSVMTIRDLLASALRVALVAVASGPALAPRGAIAARAPRPTLKADLMLILRVQEATGQETRLVSTGKYKELQRLDVKRAINMMVNNYDLDECFIRSSAFAAKGKTAAASGYGSKAVESLIQILEYFPDKLKVLDLTKEQSGFILGALDSTSRNIDFFLELMPPDELAAARAQVEEENELNLKEYGEGYPDGKYLNTPEVASM